MKTQKNRATFLYLIQLRLLLLLNKNESKTTRSSSSKKSRASQASNPTVSNKSVKSQDTNATGNFSVFNSGLQSVDEASSKQQSQGHDPLAEWDLCGSYDMPNSPQNNRRKDALCGVSELDRVSGHFWGERAALDEYSSTRYTGESGLNTLDSGRFSESQSRVSLDKFGMYSECLTDETSKAGNVTSQNVS